MAETYSNSRLSTADECQYKYYLRYMKKRYTKTDMSFFIVGGMVHTIIEDFYRSRICLTSFTPEEQTQWCIAQLNKAFIKKFGYSQMQAFSSFMSNVESALAYTTEQTGAKARPQATKLWKESFEEPLQAAKVEVDKLFPVAVPNVIFFKPFSGLYDQGIKCLTNFVTLHQRQPNASTVHEYRLDPAIRVSGIDKGGRLDRIEWLPGGGYKVFDYKTGSQYWSETTLKDSDQLCWYALALKETYGELPESVGIWDLLHGKIIEVVLTEEDIVHYKERLSKQAEKVKALEAKLVENEDAVELVTPKSLYEGYKCKSCEYYYDNEVRCKFWPKEDS